MTDPVRTALEEAVRGHVAYTSGGATYCDNCHRAWPCAPVFDLMHANSHERAATLALAALATPPASPEPERCVCWQHRDSDWCCLGHDIAQPPTPPENAAPEGLHKCWCQHGYAADSQGIPPMESPAPPESAEALRDALLDQVHGRSRNRWYQLDRDTLDAIIAAARQPLGTEALVERVRSLAHKPPEWWATRNGGDPIARAINAVTDIIEGRL